MEWFKFRMGWRRPIMRLTDEEAGRLIKAVLTYVDSGEEPETGDREAFLLCQITEILEEDIAQFKANAAKSEQMKEKRRAAGRAGAAGRWAHKSDGSACDPHPDAPDAMEPDDLPCKNKNQNKKKKKDTEGESEGEKDTYCSEQPEAVSELPVVKLILNDGTYFPVYRETADEFAQLYPAVDVDQELRCIQGWCLSNPRKRKTRGGVMKLINGWLCRKQDQADTKPSVPYNPFLDMVREAEMKEKNGEPEEERELNSFYGGSVY